MRRPSSPRRAAAFPARPLRLALVWAACCGCPAEAKVVEGRLPQESNYALFITKFCYDFLRTGNATVGRVQLDLERLTPALSATQEPVSGRLLFLVFDDERTHWKKVRSAWETSSCDEKAAAASEQMQLRLDAGKANTSYTVHISERVRPRFWYFALVACDLQTSEPIRYRFHMLNTMWGWQSEFSLDHMGLFRLYAVLTVAFGVATAGTALASRSRSSPAAPMLREHPYLQLLLLSYGASLASCTLYLAHYALFVRDGCGSMRIRFLAVLASVVANCTIFLVAILSSTGWAITSFTVPNRRWFLAMISFVGGVSALSELRAETTVDQSTRLYSYQSGPGVLALVIKIFIFCWFAFQTKATYDEELDMLRRRFYKFLGISIAGWSLNVPVVVLLAFQLSPWVRYKIVVTVEVVFRLLGQLLLSQLLCGPLSPISAKNTFPSGDSLDGLDAPYLNHLGDGRELRC